MILEFSIANTFSIHEKQTISFEAAIDDPDTETIHCTEMGGKKILKMACLYGANASGKTKMAFAFDFYLDFLVNSFSDLKPNEQTHFVPFEFNEDSRKLPGEFEIVFYAADVSSDKIIRYEYYLKLTQKEVIEESLYYAPKGQKKLLFERIKDKPVKWGTAVTGAKKFVADLVRPNCSLIGAGAQANHPVFKHIYDHFYRRFRGLITPSYAGVSGQLLQHIEKNPEFKNKVITLLSASDMGRISDIKIESQPIPEELIKQMPSELQEEITKHGEKPKTRKAKLVHSYDNEYELPLSLESAGTLRMMQLAIPLDDLTTHHSFGIIDEIESSLHQELLERFIQLFLEDSEDSQLIFTTHNQDLLDSGLLRDDEIWFCYKTDKGNSIYNSITDYTGVRKDASRKKLYQADKFGALPNIDIHTLRELFSAKKDGKDTEQ
jgi:AAA15 family ATPase/GTPase